MRCETGCETFGFAIRDYTERVPYHDNLRAENRKEL